MCVCCLATKGLKHKTDDKKEQFKLCGKHEIIWTCGSVSFVCDCFRFLLSIWHRLLECRIFRSVVFNQRMCYLDWRWCKIEGGNLTQTRMLQTLWCKYIISTIHLCVIHLYIFHEVSILFVRSCLTKHNSLTDSVVLVRFLKPLQPLGIC